MYVFMSTLATYNQTYILYTDICILWKDTGSWISQSIELNIPTLSPYVWPLQCTLPIYTDIGFPS